AERAGGAAPGRPSRRRAGSPVRRRLDAAGYAPGAGALSRDRERPARVPRRGSRRVPDHHPYGVRGRGGRLARSARRMPDVRDAADRLADRHLSEARPPADRRLSPFRTLPTGGARVVSAVQRRTRMHARFIRFTLAAAAVAVLLAVAPT